NPLLSCVDFRGEFYTQDGVLVASTVQEGVMRNHN
ncbi:hypothetical protein ACUOA8_52055, partial [Escherichia sp. SS-MK2]